MSGHFSFIAAVSPCFLRLFWRELSVVLLLDKVDKKLLGMLLSPVSGLPKAKVFNRSQSFEKLQTLQFQVVGIAILPDTLLLPCSLPSSLTRVDIKQGKILSTDNEALIHYCVHELTSYVSMNLD